MKNTRSPFGSPEATAVPAAAMRRHTTPVPFTLPAAPAAAGLGGLGRRLLVLLGALVFLATVVGAALVYTSLFRKSVSDAKEDLARHAESRVVREGAVFREAARNQAFLRDLMVERLQAPVPADIAARFWAVAGRDADGAIRNRAVDAAGVAYDGKRRAGLFLNKDAALTPELMRRLLLALELCDTYGPAYHAVLQDLFIDTPENGSAIYWPETPDWSRNAKADLDQNAEPYEVAAAVTANPARSTVWTDLYFDPPAHAWMVSCVTPVDFGGRQVATLGHDVTLSEFIARFGEGVLPGGTGMIVRDNGKLVVAPAEMDRMKALKGDYVVARDGTPAMRAVMAAIPGLPGGAGVVEVAEADMIAAVVRLPALGAYHVEMMPRSVLLADANRGALMFAGLLALIFGVQFGALIWALRRWVLDPIHELTGAAARLAANDFSRSAQVAGDDEMAQLAHTFNGMGRSLARQQEMLREQASQLEAQVHERTAEFEAARDVAEHANRAKSEFLANVSHEIRTPLNAMLGFSQLLADDARLTPAQRRRAAGISKAGESLLTLVNDTLDLSHMEVGAFTLGNDPFLPATPVDDAVAWIAAQAAAKSVAVTSVTRGWLPGRLRGDACRIDQVLRTMLAAALKFTDRGEIALIVSAVPLGLTGESRARLVFEVIDTSVGVTDAALEGVFEGRLRTGPGGVGLGLSLSRELARRMGGDIRVDHAPSGGVRFTFGATCEVLAEVAEAPVGAALSVPVTATRMPCLLLVDDIPENLDVLRESLRAIGYDDFLEAEDGEQALAWLAEKPVDLVLTDLNMPRLDGFGLLLRVRGNTRLARVPVVAITAGMVDRHGHTAMEAGFDAFLEKPYRISALAEIVTRLAGLPPVANPVAAPVPTPPVTIFPEVVATPAGATRVLILDDDDMTREVMHEFLAVRGYTTTAAADGAAALEILARGECDLVLFDMHMPGMDGLEFVRRYRAGLPHGQEPLPMICTAGLITDDERVALESHGARDFLCKPFRGAQLCDAVAKRLGR